MIDTLPVAPAWLLLFAAITLYVVDVAQLLFVNELLFVRAGPSRWRALFPLGRPELARRYLVLPSVLRPDRAVWRLTWPARVAQARPAGDAPAASVEATIRHLAALRWFGPVLLVVLLLGAPAGYLLFDALGFLAVIAVAYLFTLLALATLVRARARVGLSWLALASLAFESLVCIPYSINLYRKVTLRVLPRDVDVLAAGRELVAGTEHPSFLAGIESAVGRRLQWLTPGSADYQRLEATRRELGAGRGTDGS